jgi:FtsZ-interacting cell division protein ZipA
MNSLLKKILIIIGVILAVLAIGALVLKGGCRGKWSKKHDRQSECSNCKCCSSDNDDEDDDDEEDGKESKGKWNKEKDGKGDEEYSKGWKKSKKNDDDEDGKESKGKMMKKDKRD